MNRAIHWKGQVTKSQKNGETDNEQAIKQFRIPSETRRPFKVELMLAQRRRRWANINSTLNKYIKFAWESESGKLHPLPSGLYCRPNTKGDFCHCRTRDNGRILANAWWTSKTLSPHWISVVQFVFGVLWLSELCGLWRIIIHLMLFPFMF